MIAVSHMYYPRVVLSPVTADLPQARTSMAREVVARVPEVVMV